MMQTQWCHALQVREHNKLKNGLPLSLRYHAATCLNVHVGACYISDHVMGLLNRTCITADQVFAVGVCAQSRDS